MRETSHPQFRIEIDPEEIVLTDEEILADLLYPAPASVASIDRRQEHGHRRAELARAA